jgi:hypothetical protein
MRLSHYLLLTLLATAAAAQNNDFNYYPSFAEPQGGTEIHILATSSSGSLRFTAPQVFFGDVPSPRVTLLNAYQADAVVPAHAIGIVSVTVRDNGALLKSLGKFVFAPASEEIIIPIAIQPTSAAYGTRWMSDISVFNDSDDSVAIDPEICSSIGTPYVCNPPPARVPPHSSMRIEPRSVYADYPFMALRPPADHAGNLHFTVRLRETSRDPDGPGTEIPVIRTKDFQQKQVWLPSIPTSTRFRANLRVFTRAATVIVRVRDNATGELLLQREIQRNIPTDGDPFITLTFNDLFESPVVRAHDKVRIEVESGSEVWSPSVFLPVWAMVTLTDNESQRVQIFTPQ